MAKDVVMFVLDDCPYCKEAFKIMEDLKVSNPEYGDIEIEIVEETRQPERSGEFDYYYVPTYFVDGKKVHEGVPSEEAVERVYRAALT